MEEIKEGLPDEMKTTLERQLMDYRRQVQENVLCDILMRFMFADWTRRQEYTKLTGEDVVNKVATICKQIETDYSYSLEDDLFPLPF